MTKHVRAITLCLAVSVGCTHAQRSTTRPIVPATQPVASTQPTDPVIASIRDEGLNHSQVMDTLDVLCNVIGPRLTASPGQVHASEWTRDHLASWGLSNAHLEPWGPFGRGWTVDRFSFRMTTPTTIILSGYPKAWSPGFEEPLSSEVIFVDASDEAGLEKYKGKLAGKIVLLGQPRVVEARFLPLAKRLEDSDLQKLADFKPGQEAVPQAQPAETASERRARFAAANSASGKLLSGARPTTSQPATAPTSVASSTSSTTSPATSPATTQSFPRGYDPFFARLIGFASDEGAAVLVNGSSQGDGGTFFCQQSNIPNDPPRRGWATTRPRVWSDVPPKIPAQIVLTSEDYNRLARIAKRGEPLHAELDLATSFHGTSISPSDTIAEIPGTDLADQVVMVGAHLDSWHSGTGATDNGVGSACAMEAIRIIRALNLHPRRTIRVALWTGEEQGLFGSTAYVKKHFGYTPEDTTQPATTSSTISSATSPAATMMAATTTAATHHNLVKLPEYEKLSAYFNLDNGTGRIRGIYAQSNPAAVPLFRDWLAPFGDLDAKTITLEDTGSTDHIPFDDIGLPGFQFIQDPIEYGSRTHHSNQDVYDRIQADDAKQASTIMAAFLWDAANMPERFPRKPTP